jgi:GTP-sensing pleiotropic transcriptional regulator CodY
MSSLLEKIRKIQKELQDLTGIPYQEIKKDIFKLIDDEVDLSNEPFSKLRRDMADELGLI